MFEQGLSEGDHYVYSFDSPDRGDSTEKTVSFSKSWIHERIHIFGTEISIVNHPCFTAMYTIDSLGLVTP